MLLTKIVQINVMITQPVRDLNGSIERIGIIKELVSRTINMQVPRKILDNIPVIDMEYIVLVKSLMEITGAENEQNIHYLIQDLKTPDFGGIGPENFPPTFRKFF